MFSIRTRICYWQCRFPLRVEEIIAVAMFALVSSTRRIFHDFGYPEVTTWPSRNLVWLYQSPVPSPHCGVSFFLSTGGASHEDFRSQRYLKEFVAIDIKAFDHRHSTRNHGGCWELDNTVSSSVDVCFRFLVPPPP